MDFHLGTVSPSYGSYKPPNSTPLNLFLFFLAQVPSNVLEFHSIFLNAHETPFHFLNAAIFGQISAFY